MKLQKFSDVFPNTPKVPDTKEAVTELAEKVNKSIIDSPEYREAAIRAQEQADCEMRLVAYKAELIQKIEKMSTPVAGMIWKDRVLSIIKEK